MVPLQSLKPLSMASTTHIVKRQLLELHGVRKAEAAERQNQLKHLYYQKLLPLLDQYLSKWNSGEERIRIDQLVLDLGVVKISHFESDFIKQLEVQLEKQLKDIDLGSATEVTGPNDAAKSATPLRSEVELLAYFVKTGNLPWWVQTMSGNPVEAAFHKAIAEQPKRLVAQLRNWIQQEHYTRRIIRQLSTETLDLLVQLQVPVDSTAFQKECKDFLLILEPISTIWGTSVYRLREESYLRLLQLLFIHDQSFPHALALWEAWMLQMAQAYRQPYAAWLQLLSEMFRETQLASKLLHSRLPNILRQLLDLMHNRSPKPKAATLSEEDSLDRTSNKEWDKLVKKWEMDLDRPDQMNLLRRLSKGKSLSEPFSQQWRQLPFGEKWSDWTGANRERLFRLLQQLEQEQQSDMQKRSAATKSDSANVFSAVQETFINNAGLVILWPYLANFFGALGLIEGKQFLNKAAAHRAAGLLQHLADGQLETPEYLLGFNKLLCGLEWDEVLDFGEPITKYEIEECELFLRAVIGNAAVLKNMTPDGFRGSFLLRKGMLKPRGDVWELYVEPAPYDIVLQRFPWSWQVVKLPWLAVPVLVEWPTGT